MGKTIFRRIGGRIIPISVEKIVKTFPAQANRTQITYKMREGFKRIGEVWADQWMKKPHRFTVGSHINKEFRGSGLGTEFYKLIAKDVKNLGGKTLVGSTDNVNAIKKIRGRVGYTRGFVGKSNYSGTTFVTSLKKVKK